MFTRLVGRRYVATDPGRRGNGPGGPLIEAANSSEGRLEACRTGVSTCRVIWPESTAGRNAAEDGASPNGPHTPTGKPMTRPCGWHRGTSSRRCVYLPASRSRTRRWKRTAGLARRSVIDVVLIGQSLGRVRLGARHRQVGTSVREKDERGDQRQPTASASARKRKPGRAGRVNIGRRDDAMPSSETKGRGDDGWRSRGWPCARPCRATRCQFYVMIGHVRVVDQDENASDRPPSVMSSGSDPWPTVRRLAASTASGLES